MPLNSPSSLINFIFNLATLLHTSYTRFHESTQFSLDAQGVSLALLAILLSLVMLWKKMNDHTIVNEKSSQPPLPHSQQQPQQENLILLLLQRLFFGWLLIYFHVYHSAALLNGDLLPIVVIRFGILMLAILLLHILLTPCFGGLFPVRWIHTFDRVWTRFFFFLPPDSREILWILLGYAFTRSDAAVYVGGASEIVTKMMVQGKKGAAGLTAPSFSPSVPSAYGEICSYSSTSPSTDILAVRSVYDIPLLVLFFSCIIHPYVEFARTFIVKCSGLYAAAGGPVANVAPVPKRKKRSRGNDVMLVKASDDEEEEESSDDDEEEEAAAASKSSSSSSSSIPFLSRILTFSNTFLSSLTLTWLFSVCSLAYAYVYTIVLEMEDSSCPHIGTKSYRTELGYLQTDCQLQWAYLQNMLLLSSLTIGVLTSITSQIMQAIPATFRLQVFVTLCITIWKGTILPEAMSIATRCLV